MRFFLKKDIIIRTEKELIDIVGKRVTTTHVNGRSVQRVYTDITTQRYFLSLLAGCVAYQWTAGREACLFYNATALYTSTANDSELGLMVDGAANRKVQTLFIK